MMQLNVTICGSRDFEGFWPMVDFLDTVLVPIRNTFNITIIEGGARGADNCALRYAILRKFDRDQYPADWKGLGKKAGFVRNAQMVKVSDVLIAFWDGESSGTQDSIERAVKKSIPTIIYRYDLDGVVIRIPGESNEPSKRTGTVGSRRSTRTYCAQVREHGALAAAFFEDVGQRVRQFDEAA